MKGKNLTITGGDIERAILAVNEMAEALYHAGYGTTAQGIMKADESKTAGENAVKFVADFADLTGATLRMIANTTGLIADGITNGEIEITLKGEE